MSHSTEDECIQDDMVILKSAIVMRMKNMDRFISRSGTTTEGISRSLGFPHVSGALEVIVETF
jgi:hypothetical protein